MTRTRNPSAPGSGAPHDQYAALCWRHGRKGIEVLLITSRDSGRWVIPKGWPIKGLTPDQAAAREAWEEAGVQGAPQPHCIGLFSYEKIGNRALAVPDSRSCLVAVYPLEVARLTDDFPEKAQRRRKWFAPAKAALKVDEAELQTLLAEFAPPEPAKPATVRAMQHRAIR